MIGKAGIGLVLAAAAAMASSPGSKDSKPDKDTKKDDRAHELFAEVCTACHDLNRVKIQQLSKEEWAGLIKGMVSEGAAVTDEEMDLIVGYLAQNFGYKSPADKK